MEILNSTLHYLGVATPILIALSYAMFYYIKKDALKKYKVLKTNYRVIYALLTLCVLAIFSVGSGLFDAYNKTSRAPYSYNWMNFNDLLSFPFESLQVQFGEPKATIIEGLDITSEIEKYNYVIVIDMTGSTTPQFQDYDALKNRLKQNILDANIPGKDQPRGIEIELNNIDDTRNLYALSILASIYERSSAPIPADISYNFIYYLGESDAPLNSHIVFNNESRPYSYKRRKKRAIITKAIRTPGLS